MTAAAGAPASAFDLLVERLEVMGYGPLRRGMARCPAHDDQTPSLSVTAGNGRALVHCQAGCDVASVLRALDMRSADLFDTPATRERHRSGNGRDHGQQTRPQRVAEYLYTDRDGEPLARKVRVEPGVDGKPKSFTWEIPDGRGGWRAPIKDRGENGNPKVIYRLPELLEADGPVHFCEGEKAVDAILAAEACATCTPTTSAPTAEILAPLRGRDMIVWQDRDESGRKQALAAVAPLRGIARSVRLVQSATTEEHDDAHDHLAAGFDLADAVELDLAESVPDPARLGFAGPRLLALLTRPKPQPVDPSLLTPGHLSVLVAPPMTGKSSEAYWLGMARAAGVAPWEGAPARAAGRVLFYSLDEAPEQAVRRMHSLATFHPAGALDRYADNLVVIGPDREVDPDVLDPLRFDEQGLATLREWLEAAAVSGRPFAEVWIDAYADMLPLGESENANEVATRIGGELERIAVETGPGIGLLHHAGKPGKDAGSEPADVRYLGRGASALAAKARVVMSLERVVGMSHLRRVRTVTNLSRAPRELLLQVCSPEADCEELIYFRPHDPLAAHEPADYLGADFITTSALAWALARRTPEEGKRPPGEANDLATRLREEWLRKGLIEVKDGPRNAKLLRIRQGVQDGGVAW